MYNSDRGIPIIFDSGYTHEVIYFKVDFIGDIKPVRKLMNGLGATSEFVEEGTVLWQFRDDFGVIKRVKVPIYLVPASKVRIFSPQSYFRQEGGEEFTMNVKGIIFTFANGGSLSFNYA